MSQQQMNYSYWPLYVFLKVCVAPHDTPRSQFLISKGKKAEKREGKKAKKKLLYCNIGTVL